MYVDWLSPVEATEDQLQGRGLLLYSRAMKRALNYVMTWLFGEWAEYAANGSFTADDGSIIASCEWHWRRWADGGWHRMRMSAEVQREVAWDAAIR